MKEEQMMPEETAETAVTEGEIPQEESVPEAEIAVAEETPQPLPETEEKQEGGGENVADFETPVAESYILQCKDVCKMYGSLTALYQITLNIPTGGIVGLLGPNGSGKTTLIKLAMGMLHPNLGEILIDGKKPGAESRAITAYLPDANYLTPWMTVHQQMKYYADFFPDFREDRADAMLTRLGIQKGQKIKTLSKGNKEKLGLILTMARDAKLYILDEPIAGVDPAARDFILETILAQKPKDATIFLCTHLIADIEPVLTHAIFLRNGQIALNARAKEITEKTGKSLDQLFREVFRW